MKKKPSDRKPWTPFVKTDMKGQDGEPIYINSRYQVEVDHIGFGEPFGEVLELSVKRHDREPIMDWRDIQRIKNEFFGPDATAIQIFPPEKYLVDTANQYYFYVFTQYEFPFGFKDWLVIEKPADKAKQRPFDPEHRPTDLEDMQKKYDDFVHKHVRFKERKSDTSI